MKSRMLNEMSGEMFFNDLMKKQMSPSSNCIVRGRIWSLISLVL